MSLCALFSVMLTAGHRAAQHPIYARPEHVWHHEWVGSTQGMWRSWLLCALTSLIRCWSRHSEVPSLASYIRCRGKFFFSNLFICFKHERSNADVTRQIQVRKFSASFGLTSLVLVHPFPPTRRRWPRNCGCYQARNQRKGNPRALYFVTWSNMPSGGSKRPGIEFVRRYSRCALVCTYELCWHCAIVLLCYCCCTLCSWIWIEHRGGGAGTVQHLSVCTASANHAGQSQTCVTGCNSYDRP